MNSSEGTIYWQEILIRNSQSIEFNMRFNKRKVVIITVIKTEGRDTGRSVPLMNTILWVFKNNKYFKHIIGGRCSDFVLLYLCSYPTNICLQWLWLNRLFQKMPESMITIIYTVGVWGNINSETLQFNSQNTS